ncbi:MULTISPECIES: ATP-binding protein [unclassified Luteimonas]|uniref:ATP-binding protein n=1 Tax=unclassified Luteimonas TaxID=2629088 RepID=UPI0018F0A108|nr:MULTISPECIES: ATP-binding protein [unclassified Luteimonas]MBJ6977792.1 PAS domain S-box protein [Luteimonas sp. MC1895]MBJ6984611.1 PAS domain S-box protein [Luteimonas sp. MC1750]QQO04785.1 PAS domain S-box protein [Luteimonas sp. MC1750]
MSDGALPVHAIPGLFEAVPDALVVIGPDGRILHANGQAEALFGHPRGSLEGREIEDLLPAAARARHRDYRDRYMGQPHVRPMGATGQTLTGLRSDGSEFAVEIALSPLQSTAGPRYLASVRDISGTQRVRQALARARYDAIAARIGQLALETGTEAELLELLPGLLAEALGVDSVAILAAPHDAHPAGVRAAIGPAWSVAGTTPRPFAGQHREAWIIDDVAVDPSAAALFPLPLPPSGSAVMVPVLERHRVAGALLASAREPRRFDHDTRHLLQSAAATLGAFVQQRRAEEQLAHAHRLDAIGQLTGGVAHDFNNLLTVMSGSLQLLETEVASDSGRELLASALRTVGRGAELTAKLLAFARRQRLLPREVDVPALLHDVERVLRSTLGDAVRLRLEVEDGVSSACIDAGQLEAALLNLVLNARDALPQGGEIVLGAGEESVKRPRPGLPAGRYLRLSVRDTGRGMPADVLARAMEPFFTTKGRERGSGLGLSMVHGFARQSGGDLEIDSSPGVGTEARLYLPLGGAGANDAPATPVSAASSSGSGERVLVVEDDPAVRAITVAFLRTGGYAVEAVADAEAALVRLREDDGFALLFTDVMLGPGMDGKRLAVAARGLRPGLPVLLTSGDEEHAADAAATSGLRLLRKPWRREVLVEAVRDELAR